MPDAISAAGPTAPAALPATHPAALPATQPASATGARPAGAQQAVASDTPTVDPSVLQRPDTFDRQMFLQLLVAQLKYQNPLDPMDSSEFMAQTAQFTTVEKLTELTDSLQESLANDRLATATGMIGRQVTFTRLDGSTATSTVQSVRFQLTGPVLVTAERDEVGLGAVAEVSART